MAKQNRDAQEAEFLAAIIAAWHDSGGRDPEEWLLEGIAKAQTPFGEYMRDHLERGTGTGRWRFNRMLKALRQHVAAIGAANEAAKIDNELEGDPFRGVNGEPEKAPPVDASQPFDEEPPKEDPEGTETIKFADGTPRTVLVRDTREGRVYRNTAGMEVRVLRDPRPVKGNVYHVWLEIVGGNVPHPSAVGRKADFDFLGDVPWTEVSAP